MYCNLLVQYSVIGIRPSKRTYHTQKNSLQSSTNKQKQRACARSGNTKRHKRNKRNMNAIRSSARLWKTPGQTACPKGLRERAHATKATRATRAAGKEKRILVPGANYTDKSREEAKKPAQAGEEWQDGRPTRAIASALLKVEGCTLEHKALYEAVDRSGLLRSHRHFKQCLKMMRLSRRACVRSIGLARVGDSRPQFTVSLTRKGRTIYEFQRDHWQPGGWKPVTDSDGILADRSPAPPEAPSRPPGLSDAL